jgi:hypothetical protein
MQPETGASPPQKSAVRRRRAPRPRRYHYDHIKPDGKLRLLARERLDGRTRVRRQFDAIASGIAKDLGGEAALSTVQKHLVEAFAGCAVTLNDINARAMLGQPIDIMAYSTAVSTLVRVAAKLGVTRQARDVTSITEYLDQASGESVDGE